MARDCEAQGVTNSVCGPWRLCGLRLSFDLHSVEHDGPYALYVGIMMKAVTFWVKAVVFGTTAIMLGTLEVQVLVI